MPNSAPGVHYAPLEKIFTKLISPMERFVHRQSSSGILLMLTTVLALILANSALSGLYFALKEIPVAVGFGVFILSKPLLLWVNDLLMAFFFFVVGLELKRELLFGELASWRKAALPAVAALGGMVVPAAIYFLFNPSGPTSAGWAIPMATDIAFAIGVLVLLGSRVPKALMAFLVAIAIIDDLGAVTVIALFYSENISLHYLLAAAAIMALMYIFNRAGVRRAVPYFILAMGLWFVLLKSGIHPTLAGVIGAFLLPARPRYDPIYFSSKAKALLTQFDSSYADNPTLVKNEKMRELVETLDRAVQNVSTPSQRLEHIWHLPVAYLVVPLFAFINAGITLDVSAMRGLTADPVFLGVFFGLLLGKFIGIFGFSWLVVRAGWLQLPEGVNFQHVAGMALLAGIGFTMSIFISSLAFPFAPELLTMAKTGILAASLVAGVLGSLLLILAARQGR